MKYFPLLLAICVVSTLGKVIYVDSTASSGGNGQQGTPFNTIQGAVNSGSVADGDQVSIAFGYYTVFDMTITNKNVDVYAPNGAYVTCNDTTSQAFTISSTSGVSIRNLYFSKCMTSIILFLNSTGGLVQGCTFNNNSGSPSGGVVQLRTGSKVNIESSSFSFNTITSVLVTTTCTANITNSFFTRNSGGSASQGGGITAASSTVFVSSSKFISNLFAIYAQTSTLNIINNNFYGNSKTPSSNFSIICTSPTLTQSGNTFCGYLGASVSCGSWTPVLTAADSCGICNGNNENKDCNGYCFGNATGCPAKKTIWVVPGGNGTKDGSSKANAMATIQAAIDSAAYGDTVKLGEGSYSAVGDYNLDTKGKAITITSEYGQPERTIITCADLYSNSGIISSSGESYDTIIRGLTFSACYYGAQVTNSNPTFQSVIFTQCFSAGAYLTGSTSSFTDCDFSTNGQTTTTALSGLFSITTTGYYASNKVKYSRFSNNVNFRAGGLFVGNYVIVSLDSCFLIQNKIYSGTNGNSIYAEPYATLNVYNTSINTNLTTGNSVYCVISTTTVNQTSNTFCGNNGNTISCNQWGTATLLNADGCGVCGGSNASRDCNGTCFGRNELDSQGGCCLYWQKDCNMICNGKSTYDSFGTCCVLPKTIDCTGKCGGTYKNDKNGVCCDASIIDNNNVCCTNGTIDCNGICNGGWVPDTKGQCCPIAWKDYCGVCNGTNDSCQTCAKSCLNGGTCNNTIQTCSCTGGYYGEQCESFSCPAGCHGGSCVAPNMCNCNGTNGSPPNCLPSVTCGNITCYNNGTCNADACDCSGASGYFGTECTNFTCTTTCKNNGVCIGPNLCDCSNSNGFYGNLCDQFTCPNGCSNGVCTSPNTCSCLQGWGGPTCATEQGVSVSATIAPLLTLVALASASLFVL